MNSVCWPPVGPQDIKQTYIHALLASRAAQIIALASYRPIAAGHDLFQASLALREADTLTRV